MTMIDEYWKKLLKVDREEVPRAVERPPQSKQDVGEANTLAILQALIERVSGYSCSGMNEAELLEFIKLGFWPSEHHESIRQRHNKRQTKNDSN